MRLTFFSVRHWLGSGRRPARKNRSFERMLAASRGLEEALQRRSNCRRICFADTSRTGIEVCRACATAIDEAQRQYEDARKKFRGSIG